MKKLWFAKGGVRCHVICLAARWWPRRPQCRWAEMPFRPQTSIAVQGELILIYLGNISLVRPYFLTLE
jgi:hypothetical protein